VAEEPPRRNTSTNSPKPRDSPNAVPAIPFATKPPVATPFADSRSASVGTPAGSFIPCWTPAPCSSGRSDVHKDAIDASV
jgi:hypothetical protein